MVSAASREGDTARGGVASRQCGKVGRHGEEAARRADDVARRRRGKQMAHQGGGGAA
jgi:hypothetical protein